MAENEEKLVVVRVRGGVGATPDLRRALEQLKLPRKNHCVVVPNTKAYSGMVHKVKDYVTWGEISEETYKELVEKKGEEFKGRTSDSRGKVDYNNFSEVNGKKIKKVFRLNNPRKGFGRSGIKVSYNKGGALGYRGQKINDLIKRMF